MEAVRQLADAYSARAIDYADLWAPVLQPMGRQLLERLQPGEARTFLDVGTGTGTLLADIAMLAPQARIVAIDRSEGMIRLARRPAMFAVMDAQAIALRQGAVDATVMAFVIFTVPDPAGVLAEVHRVLRPEGRIGVATWGDEPEVIADRVWADELDAEGAPPDPGSPLNRRDLSNSAEKLAGLLRSAGFVDVETWTDRLDLVWPVDDYFRFMSGGPVRRRLDPLGAERRKETLSRIKERLDSLSPEDFAERSQVVFAIARRPEGA